MLFHHRKISSYLLTATLAATLLSVSASVNSEPLNAQAIDTEIRARDLGIPFSGITGPLNSITDVTGSRGFVYF